MAYQTKGAGRPKKKEKYRTIRNFKALKDFEFDRIENNKMYFKKKKMKGGKKDE